MAKVSGIQWTDGSWNPHHGCRKVSTGCKYCYMYRDKERYGQDPTTVLRSKVNFNAPLKWKDPMKIFTCSWSDWFIEEADAWRDDLWKIIKATPHHTYQILTKRPERILQCLPTDWGTGYENVWLGVSVENQENIGRCDILGKIPAKVRFVSAEPLIGAVDFKEMFAKYEFSWCIIGGESGNATGKYLYRECKAEWIKDIIADCKEQNVAVFVKQLGTHMAKELGLKEKHGGEMNEWEKAIQIREFPTIRSKIFVDAI